MQTLTAMFSRRETRSRGACITILLTAVAMAFMCPVLRSQEPLPSNALNTPEAMHDYLLYRYWQDHRDLCMNQQPRPCDPEPMDIFPPEPPSLRMKPVFSVKSGTYASPQIVTISYRWPGAVIYYTLDGRKPTPASTRYEGPLSITTTTIVKAIAIAPYFRQSKVVTAKYKLKTSKPPKS